MLTKRILGNTGKAESEDLLQEKQLKDEEFRSGFAVAIQVKSCTDACPAVPVCVCGPVWNNCFGHIQNVHVKFFSGADSCHIQVLYMLPKSPAVQRVVLEALTVARMPPNQHDKLLITSGHLSVRVRPSVTQWGWTISHNTVTQPPPAVCLNGCRCLEASVHSLGLLTHALQRRMMSLWWLQPNTWLALGNALSLQVYLYRHTRRLWGQKLWICKVNTVVISTETNALCLHFLYTSCLRYQTVRPCSFQCAKLSRLKLVVGLNFTPDSNIQIYPLS